MQTTFLQSGADDKLQLIVGDAVNSLEDLRKTGHEETFDFCYIDADKEGFSKHNLQ